MGRVAELATQIGALPLRARRTDPSTSHRAAARATLRSGSQGAKVVIALMGLPFGGTCYEIAAASGLDHVQVARLTKMLEGKRRIYRTDRERPSPHGDACIVWMAA